MAFSVLGNLGKTAWPALFAASAMAAENLSPLAGMSDPKALNDPLYRWNAKLISVPGKYPEANIPERDYATEKYGAPWDFDDGSMKNIAKTNDMKELQVSDGKLRFVTGKRPFFYWGNHFESDTYAPEEIAFNWPLDFYNRRPWFVKIRLKQSLPETKWTVASRFRGAPARTTDASVNIRGTDWQTVTFDMGFVSRGGNSPIRGSLAIQPGDKPGNRVEIDWIKVVAPHEKPVYFREALTLDKPVKKAVVCLIPNSRYAFYVNGREIKSGFGVAPRREYELVDIAKDLKPGRNVFAYVDTIIADNPTGEVALEGYVTFTDGTFQRFATGKGWKGAFQYAPGWEKPDFDDSKWPAAKVGRDIADSNWPARVDNPYGWGKFVDPPYMGPIEIESATRDPQIHQLAEGIALTIKTPNAVTALSYALRDAFTDKEIAGGALNKANDAYAFQAKPEKPGVYDLILTAWADDKILDRRFYEIALVGEIPMKEVSLDDIEKETKLKMVDRIVCAEAPGKRPFLDSVGGKQALNSTIVGNSKVGEKNGVRFRETDRGNNSWFSYKFDIKNVYVPHMVKVHYLDDRKANFELRVTETHRKYHYALGPLVPARASIGVYLGGKRYPNSGKVETLNLVYFPQYPEATADIVNLSGENPAAIVDIEIYEIVAMPAVRVPCPSGRMFGQHLERNCVRANTFYAGPDGDIFKCPYGTRLHEHYGFYKNWYIAIANQIKYLRFAGENTAFNGFWMYHQGFYPSAHRPGGAEAPRNDSMGLMFDMFAANNLYLVPCFEWMGLGHRDFRANNRYSDSDIARGANTLLQVDKDGKQLFHGYEEGFEYANPARPEVRAEMAALAAEVTKAYGYSKAFRGIGWWCTASYWGPGYVYENIEELDDTLKIGFDDYTIALFEKDTGVKLPDDVNRGPDRFQKRYDWIVKNEKERWVDFKCQIIRDAVLAIRDAIVKKDPNAKLFAFPAPIGKAKCVMLREWLKGRPTKDIFRYLSFDYDLYKNQKNLSVGSYRVSDSCAQFFRRVAPEGLMGDFLNADDVNAYFDNGDNSCVMSRQGFYENEIRPPIGKDGKRMEWYWAGKYLSDAHDYSRGNPAPLPGHRYGVQDFVDALEKTTPEALFYAFQDVTMNIGHQDRVRRFGVPFQSIPPGTYRPLTGGGLDKNLVVRANETGAFYIVNPYWWDVTATVKLSEKTEVLNLVTGEKTETGAIKLKLGAYDIEVFQVRTGNWVERIFSGRAAPVTAETDVSEEGRRYVASQLDDVLKYGNDVTEGQCRLMEIERAPRDLKALAAKAKKRFAANDLSGAMKILETFPMITLRNYIDTLKKNLANGKNVRAVETFPFRVNCGATEPYKDSAGNVWSPDQSFAFGANAYGYAEGTPFDRAQRTGGPGTLGVVGTKDVRIYETELTGVKTYCVKLPNGHYKIRLHYVEAYKERPDEKTTDPGVSINGEKAFDAFNLGNEAGGFKKPLTKTVSDATVNDGMLRIAFNNLAGGRLNGVEVFKK